MKDFKISGLQGLENTSVEPNLTELRADENEKTEKLFGRAFMKKVFGRTKDYACPKSHRYSRRTVMVDGMSYQVINITPTSLDFMPKKAKELFAYLINGREK